MKLLSRLLPLALVLGAACTGESSSVVLESDAGGTGATSATTVVADDAASLTTAAPTDSSNESPAVEPVTPGADEARAASVLDRYNEAMAGGDYEAAAGLLAFDSIYFFDLVAALAESGERVDFDGAPLLAGHMASVLRGFGAHPLSGVEAFRHLASLGQVPLTPGAEKVDWFGDDQGNLFGLIDSSTFVLMRGQPGGWRVDITPVLIRAESSRHEYLMKETGLPSTAQASELLFMPLGYLEDEPPVPLEGGAMSLLAAPVWNQFLRAVDSSEWTEAYGLLGSVTLLNDARGVPAVELARRNALTADESTFAGLPFADGLLALTLRALYTPQEIVELDGATIFGLGMQTGAVRLSTSNENLAWRTTSGIRFLGENATDVAGVFRSGPDWLVDGNVIAGGSPRDFGATAGISISDPVGLLLAALNEVTNGSFDLSILAPVG